MRKVFFLVFIILLLIIILEAGYYVLVVSRNNKASVVSKNTSTPTPIPNSPVSASANPNLPVKILYQESGDNKGRTVIYDYTSPGGFKGYSGIGLNTTNYKQTPFIVGAFDKLETIPDSTDRHLYLYDPLTQKPLDKVKIVAATKFGIEYLDKPVTVTTDYQTITDKNPMSANTLGGIIKKGDTIVVLLLIDKDKKPVTDNGAYVAQVIAVRRF